MAVTVTATQGGTNGPANGMVLRVVVLTSAAATQNGAVLANQEASTTDLSENLVTTQAGSRAYGACNHDPNNAATAKANTALIDDIADATNVQRYVTFKGSALTGTPGSTNFGFTIPAAGGGPYAIAEIKTAGTLTEDASGTGVVASTTTATAVTTPSFTPPGGSLLVALICCNGGTGTETMAVTDTGGGYTWTALIEQHVAGANYAGVWIAPVPAGGGAAATPAPLVVPQAAVMRDANW